MQTDKLQSGKKFNNTHLHTKKVFRKLLPLLIITSKQLACKIVS